MKGAIAELDYFVGRWRVEGKDPQSGKTFVLDLTIEPTLRGRWYSGSGTAPELDLEFRDLWGKDLASGEITRTIFDSAQTCAVLRSVGWQGDVLVLEGNATGAEGRAHVRETITRRGPDEWHAVWELQSGGTWTPYSVEILRRQ